MKTVINSCLTGGVVGFIVLFIATQNDLNPDYAMMIPIGIFAGSFWGCIVGLIINNRKESVKKKYVPNSDLPVKNTPNSNVEKDIREDLKEINHSSSGFINIAKTVGFKSNKEIVTEVFQTKMNIALSSYMKRNSEILKDPIFGPMKIMNFINVTSKEFKPEIKKLEFNLTEEDINDIIKEIHNGSIEKVLK